ncbi:unnamed protein product [Gadus morhua 'NCC']
MKSGKQHAPGRVEPLCDVRTLETPNSEWPRRSRARQVEEARGVAYGERQEGDWTSVLVWDCGQTLAAKLRGLTSEDGLANGPLCYDMDQSVNAPGRFVVN